MMNCGRGSDLRNLWASSSRRDYRTCVVSAFAALVLLTAIPARSQTIAAYEYPQGVQQALPAGGTVYIDPQDQTNFPMPKVAFYISDISQYSTCTQVDWSISVSYTDPDGYGTTYSGSGVSKPASNIWTVNWTDDVGGTATVTPTLYNCHDGQVGNSPSFTFYIWGRQQTQSQVDAQEGGMPWFAGLMISVESCYGDDQFAPNTGFCHSSSNVAGHPLWGTPDGIGLMQPDRTKDPGVFSNCTYWNYVCNMQAANQVLADLNSGTDPPYAFWDRQMQQMCRFLQGSYSSGAQAGDGSCSAVQQPGSGAPPGGPNFPSGSNDFYAPQSLPNCSAQFTLYEGQNSGWKDAELIKAYNGASTYYVLWYTDQIYRQYEYWAFNTYSGAINNNYVYNICNAPSY